MLSGWSYLKYEWLMFHFGKICVSSVCVEPKTERQDTTWSPESKRAAKVEKTAAIPEANAKPSSAPSILQTFSIHSEVFGFAYRE